MEDGAPPESRRTEVDAARPESRRTAAHVVGRVAPAEGRRREGRKAQVPDEPDRAEPVAVVPDRPAAAQRDTAVGSGSARGQDAAAAARVASAVRRVVAAGACADPAAAAVPPEDD
ncbi:hypothetical protein [Nocardia sp. NPDC057455]|uniref:hypothetical protein n=1 Tax=Nocardia sp. NPDC057455 TaxID=3346138 RepID=UPI0036722909